MGGSKDTSPGEDKRPTRRSPTFERTCSFSRPFARFLSLRHAGSSLPVRFRGVSCGVACVCRSRKPKHAYATYPVAARDSRRTRADLGRRPTPFLGFGPSPSSTALQKPSAGSGTILPMSRSSPRAARPRNSGFRSGGGSPGPNRSARRRTLWFSTCRGTTLTLQISLLVVLRVCWKLPCFPPANRRAWTLAVHRGVHRGGRCVVWTGSRSLGKRHPVQGVSQLVAGEGPFVVV